MPSASTRRSAAPSVAQGSPDAPHVAESVPPGLTSTSVHVRTAPGAAGKISVDGCERWLTVCESAKRERKEQQRKYESRHRYDNVSTSSAGSHCGGKGNRMRLLNLMFDYGKDIFSRSASGAVSPWLTPALHLRHVIHFTSRTGVLCELSLLVQTALRYRFLKHACNRHLVNYEAAGCLF